MTNRKTTKRALLGSVLALVLCFAMLLGSTYAWFSDTDSVNAAVIKSGTLDMELSVWNGSEWNKEPTEIFAVPTGEWWEPGYTVVEYFKIENLGNLALQWQARIDATGTLEETLANNIIVYVKDFGNTDITVADDRADLADWTRAGTLAEFVATTSAQASNPTKGVILPHTNTGAAVGGENAEYLGVALVLQTTAGNECQNKVLLEEGKTMTLTIVATQVSVENDELGADYDADIDINQFPNDAFKKYPSDTNN